MGDFCRIVFLSVDSASLVQEDVVVQSIDDFNPEVVGDDILKFVEGLADGLTNTNIEQPLAACWKDATISIADLKEAVADFDKKTTKSIIAGLKKLADTYNEIKLAIVPCTATEADLVLLVTDLTKI